METAVADIMDNSITSGASSIQLRFAWNAGEPWLAIIDDGSGMSADEVTNAMRLGSCNPLNTRPVEDLGRFGLGLKTASFSQCRQLTVITRKQQQTSARQWDLDSITENPDSGWNLHILSDEEIDGIDEISSIIDDFLLKDSGTIILWRKLDRLDNFDESGVEEKKLNSLINEARKHIELTFHRFLSSSRGKKNLRISINGYFLEAFNPFNPSNLANPAEQKIKWHEEKIEVQSG
ncbi:MAG: ATP-binding protein [Methylococcaceae bacterium]